MKEYAGMMGLPDAKHLIGECLSGVVDTAEVKRGITKLLQTRQVAPVLWS